MAVASRVISTGVVDGPEQAAKAKVSANGNRNESFFTLSSSLSAYNRPTEEILLVLLQQTIRHLAGSIVSVAVAAVEA
jgi:hypothetical protein